MWITLANGGPPGVIYELLVAVFYYSFIAASIAEVNSVQQPSTETVMAYILNSQLASSVPSAGGVYHWATIAPGPKSGRMLGFFAGSLNFFGWLFDLASIVYIMSELVVQMYSLYHPDHVTEAWQLFVALALITWLCIGATIFFNQYLSYLQHFGLLMILLGGLVTIVVLAAMPSQHASRSFVWTDWANVTGWGDGVAFLTGVLNGAFTIGTTDSITHMAEELPNPRRDLPRAVAAQMILGASSTFLMILSLDMLKPSLRSCIRIRHSPLLRNIKSHGRDRQHRLIPPRRGILAGDRKPCRHIRSPIHRLPVPRSLHHRNLPHRRPKLVGSCSRQRNPIRLLFLRRQRRSQLSDPGDGPHRHLDHGFRRHHTR